MLHRASSETLACPFSLPGQVLISFRALLHSCSRRQTFTTMRIYHIASSETLAGPFHCLGSVLILFIAFFHFHSRRQSSSCNFAFPYNIHNTTLAGPFHCLDKCSFCLKHYDMLVLAARLLYELVHFHTASGETLAGPFHCLGKCSFRL